MPVFLAPWFLVAGLAAAVPVAIHLLHRRKPAPIVFSTVRFLQEALIETRRSRHLTHAGVLLLRMLIILLLAAAFARPKVRVSSWLPEGRRHVIVVVDSSASMRCRHSGGQTSFERAADWAADLVQSLGSGDRVALMLPGREDPFALFPPSSDLARVEGALRGAECGWQQADVAKRLVELFNRLPEDARGWEPEIHVFSDFQAADWSEAALDSLAARLEELGAALFLNRVTPAQPVNAGIREVRTQPNAILGAGAVRALVTLGADAGFSGGNSVVLEQDGDELDRQGASLTPGAEEELALRTSVRAERDFFTATIRLSEDVYTPDNLHFVALPRRDAVPVLIVDGGSASGGGMDSFFLQRALRPGMASTTLFAPDVIGRGEFDNHSLDRYRAVLLCNPAALGDAEVLRLEQFVEGGGMVTIFPGDQESVAENLSRFTPFKTLRAVRDVRSERSSVRLIGTDAPGPVERRTEALLSELPAIPLRTRLVFDAVPASVRTAFRYEDGPPFALQASYGSGTLGVLSLSAGRDWSDWPLSPHFVVFLHELLRSGFRDSEAGFMISAGESLTIPAFGRGTVADFQLAGPDGETRLVSAERTGAGAPFAVSGLTVPGLWTLRAGDREWRAAVNIPPSERSLEFIDAAPLLQAFSEVEANSAATPAELRTRLEMLHRGRPVWPVLLIAAFALTILEEIIANLRSSTRSLAGVIGALARRGRPGA
ncbi:MAG: BatA domain-containing protein [Verrucomicrobiota bacterium]